MKLYFKIYELESKAEAKALQRAIKKVNGIKSADINFNNSIAKVKFDETVITLHRVKIAFLKEGHIVGVYGKPEEEAEGKPALRDQR